MTMIESILLDTGRIARRLTADEEKQLAWEIREAEDEAREAVQGIPAADQILADRSNRPEATRAAAVDRLEQAVVATVLAAREDKAILSRARRARAAWDRVEDLRWTLAMSARRVVRPQARKIAGFWMDEEDLINEGYIGLLNAAKRFDPERGVRFTTYARWWARAQMTRAVDEGGRPVRLTGCAVEQLRTLRRVKARFDAEQVEYTNSDLAAESGLTEDRVEVLLVSQREITSIDQPSGPQSDSRPLSQILPDDQIPIDEDVEHRMMLERMRDLVQALPDERDRYVLVRRYGLEDGEFRKLSEVGQELGLSRERVRQIERRALKWIQEHVEPATA